MGEIQQAKEASLQFSERMTGFVGLGQHDFESGYEAGRVEELAFVIEATVVVEDIDRFINLEPHQAAVEGTVIYSPLGGRCVIEAGTLDLLAKKESDANAKRMIYRLFVADRKGSPYTVLGIKEIADDAGLDVISDTTTLRVTISPGHLGAEGDSSATVFAAGMAYIPDDEFLRLLASIQSFAPTALRRARVVRRFIGYFLGQLAEVYLQREAATRESGLRAREIPLFTTDGVRDAECTHHGITTADGIGLQMMNFRRGPSEDVVMIVHGLTTSSDMFIMPEHYNLVSYLLDHGLSDVWTLDYRMSNRLPYNLQRHRYTMDDIALYDFPPALDRIRKASDGGVRIHVISHCLGAVSFAMSLFALKSTGVRSAVLNSAALTPCVPYWSNVKLRVAPFLAEYVAGLSYLDPRFSESPGLTLGKVLGRLTSLFHRECDVPACHMLSLMWGTGRPALYNHANLCRLTHERSGDLYGPTSMHYYRHVRKMVASSNTAVKFDPSNSAHQSLPDNYFEHARKVTTPLLLMTGQENRVFTYSNIECHRRLEALVPGLHELTVVPGYGHQDVFMGNRAHRDVFPRILSFIQRHSNNS